MPKPLVISFFAKKALILLIFALIIPLSVQAATKAYYPNDPFYKDQWYVRQIHAPEAWSVTQGGEQVLVAVIDGGIDIGHPDLADNIYVNSEEIPDDGIDNDENGFVDDVHGWNFVRDDGDVRPMPSPGQTDATWSHGTVNASLIAGEGDNGFGIAGIAWKTRILPLVVLAGSGFGDTRDIARAINYAVDAGADVINISLFGVEDDMTVRDAIRRANEQNILIVAAVGNDFSKNEGMNLDWTPTVPACSEDVREGVLGVTATDVLDQHAIHANTGADCVDLAAPGYDIIAAHPTEPIPSPEYEEEADIRDIVRGRSGTSLAAPLVSGAAALVKSMRPEWGAAEIYEHLLTTSDAISGSRQLDDPAPLGQGRLNVGRAIRDLAAERSVRIASDTTPSEAVQPSFQETLGKNVLQLLGISSVLF